MRIAQRMSAVACVVGIGLGAHAAQADWVDATVYTFEGEGAATLQNSGPVGGNLSPIGTPELVASPEGQAYQFEATSAALNTGPFTSEGLSTAAFANVDYAKGFRVEVRFMSEGPQTNDHPRLVDHGDWYISLNPNGHLRFGGSMGGGMDTARNVGSGLLDGQWHTVVLTYDTEVGGAYGRLSASVDGGEVIGFDLTDGESGTHKGGAPDFSAAKIFRIGTLHDHTSSNRAFNGAIDYVKVQVVPEPGACGLFASGLAMMVGRRRRTLE